MTMILYTISEGHKQLWANLRKGCSAPDVIIGYSDADWPGDVEDRNQLLCTCFCLGGTAISWKSSKQTCMVLFTTEAEYITLPAAAQEAMWLQQLTSDLLNKSIQEKIIHKNN